MARVRAAAAFAIALLALLPASAAAQVTSSQATQIASRQPTVRRLARVHPRAFTQATSPVRGEWQVAFYTASDREFAQVLVSAVDGRVLGVYTGIRIAWAMARGYPGAFGRHVTSPYVWLPLMALFVAPFARRRRPLCMRNLDLAALCLLSLSLAFFVHGDVGASVPLTYPPLVYLLVRMLWLVRRPPAPGPVNLPVRVLAPLVVLLLAFRVGLNLVDSNVIDVGFANVVGAQKVLDGAPLYAHFPRTIARGDTYGPVSYEAYAPFVALLGFSGSWDSLPAAHAAAIAFDLLCVVLLFAIGCRIRDPPLGVVLAYAWVSYPFTAFALECNSNDALVAALVLAAVLAADSPPLRGGLAALAGLAKFAPLAIAPLLATHRLRERGLRGLAGFAVAFAAVAVLASVPALLHDTLATVYDRTISYQAGRSTPFSAWGLYGGLGWAQTAVRVGAIALAGGLAVIPRREDLCALAAAAAAVLIAVELGASYWFYLYIPWFAGLVFVALVAPEQRRRPSGEVGRRLALARITATAAR
jgi:hypothetical protein